MSTINPFSLQTQQLTNISADVAVEFFRRLLWAEASRVGIGRNLIDVPDCINVGDGGIDAYIEDAEPEDDDVIPQGTTGFQIKSSDLQPMQCKRELHKRGDLEEPLKPEVERILDLGGNYILVLFASLPPNVRRAREDAIREELTNYGYEDPKIRVYAAEQLIGFAERYVSLVTWFKNDLLQCLPYSAWAERSDISTPTRFVPDTNRAKWIEQTREELRNLNGQCPVLRVIGLSGIGKTRLVFETLGDNDLRERVIYVNANQFRNSFLLNTLQIDDSLSAIIDIDECDINNHDEFVRAFSTRSSRLALITISYELNNAPPPTKLFRLENLGKSEIESILDSENSGLPNNVIARISEFSSGYPKIAVLLQETYLLDTRHEIDFANISDEVLFNRLVGGTLDPNSEEFRTKKVLTGLSLFSKVGYVGELSKEAEWVAQVANVEYAEFSRVVERERQRGIVQGQYYLYVAPYLLRIHLLREWWESQGLTGEEFNSFFLSIPEKFRSDLFRRFVDQIPYISATSRGLDFSKNILGSEGVFEDGKLLRTQIGAEFLQRLAEANPESALKLLLRTLGSWSEEQLLQFRTGRREIVWALEYIAIWRDLFGNAARLLLALGEAETETWSNNASGVFAGLFSLGRGELAPTEASPSERYPILVEAVESETKERRVLGLRACDNALEAQFFSRMPVSETIPQTKAPSRWAPITYGELFDAYREVWQLLRLQLDTVPEEERDQAVEILLRRMRGLIQIQNLTDMVNETIQDFVSRPYLECCDLSDLRAYSADATSHRKTGSHRIRAQRQLSRGV